MFFAVRGLRQWGSRGKKINDFWFSIRSWVFNTYVQWTTTFTQICIKLYQHKGFHRASTKELLVNFYESHFTSRIHLYEAKQNTIMIHEFMILHTCSQTLKNSKKTPSSERKAFFNNHPIGLQHTQRSLKFPRPFLRKRKKRFFSISRVTKKKFFPEGATNKSYKFLVVWHPQ